MRTFSKFAASAALLLSASVSFAQEEHEHHDMTLFGTAGNPTVQNPAQLTIEYDFANSFVHVENSQLSPGLYQTTDPGFGASPHDEAEEGLFKLATGVPVSLQITAIDPRVKLQFGGTLLGSVGESALLGTTNGADPDDNGIHTHPTWYVDLRTLAPSASEQYDVSFKLATTSGLYTESDIYTATLTTVPVPEPVGLGMLGLGAVALLGRRRRPICSVSKP